jgi:glucuronokinase
MYGDEVVDKGNLKMVEIARRHNSAAKFPGSGGAVFGLCRDAGKR